MSTAPVGLDDGRCEAFSFAHFPQGTGRGRIVMLHDVQQNLSDVIVCDRAAGNHRLGVISTRFHLEGGTSGNHRIDEKWRDALTPLMAPN